MILAMILGSSLNSLAAGLRKKIARRRATEEGQRRRVTAEEGQAEEGQV